VGVQMISAPPVPQGRMSWEEVWCGHRRAESQPHFQTTLTNQLLHLLAAAAAAVVAAAVAAELATEGARDFGSLGEEE